MLLLKASMVGRLVDSTRIPTTSVAGACRCFMRRTATVWKRMDSVHASTVNKGMGSNEKRKIERGVGGEKSLQNTTTTTVIFLYSFCCDSIKLTDRRVGLVATYTDTCLLCVVRVSSRGESRIELTSTRN